MSMSILEYIKRHVLLFREDRWRWSISYSANIEYGTKVVGGVSTSEKLGTEFWVSRFTTQLNRL